MNRWLFKTDPDTYRWNNLLNVERETWDGVLNHLALKYLRLVKKGDQIFIYHSGDDKAIVGVAKAVSNSYPDPSGKNPKLVVVDIVAQEELKKPVTLSEVKANKKLGSWELVRFSRLSVMPTTQVQWEEVLRLART